MHILFTGFEAPILEESEGTPRHYRSETQSQKAA